MSTWYSMSLGDGLWAPALFAQIEEIFYPQFEKAGKPAEMAIFKRHVSEGRLHCEVMAYYSPASVEVAKSFDAEPCDKPSCEGLDLLVGDPQCWGVLFPESGR